MTGHDPDSPYDAVVYDLDGTVLRLEVDWAACERDLESLLGSVGIDAGEYDAWELLEVAETHDCGEEAEAIIAEYERGGATEATRLPLADELLGRSEPVGICSLNCEAACRTALARHDLLEAVDVVVGRDSHPERKPAPGPLLAVVDALETDPQRTVFIGDSASDRETAERAGTAFRPAPGGRTSR
ncbi:MAG: HAD family hydrolase [Halobacteriaceae archaeon]